MKRRQVWMWIGLAISLALLLYLFAGIDYGQLWGSLASAEVTLLLPAGALIIGTVAIRAWRWRYLLQPLKSVSFPSLMSATSIGLMANMVLPFRLGELVRPLVLSHREDLDTSASFATIVVERLLDFLTILFILALLLLLVPLPSGQELEGMLRSGWLITLVQRGGLVRLLQLGGLVTLSLCLGVFALLFYLHRSTGRVVQGVRRVCWRLPAGWVDRLCLLLESFSGGLKTLGQRESLGQIIVGSAILWGMVGLYNSLVVLAFQLQLPLSVGFLLLVFQAAAVMFPSSPGFVGTHHAASVATLRLWGVGPEVALSVALVMHAVGYVLTLAIGFIYLWTTGLSLRDLTRADAALQRSPAPPT